VKKCLPLVLLAAAISAVILTGGYLLYRRSGLAPISSAARTARVLTWLNAPQDHRDWAIQAGTICGPAPFRLPTDGLVGFLWDDSFRPGHRHQGIDIFGGGSPGETPVIAVYDGYLSRPPDWKSTVIVRIPSDPLHPGRQIWTYYTHMASDEGESLVSPDFPPGTSEVFVQAGTRLGAQGNYSGNAGNPVGVHLHFSIVLDDGSGKYRNELDIRNTVDPSPYFNLLLNAHQNPETPVLCLD